MLPGDAPIDACRGDDWSIVWTAELYADGVDPTTASPTPE